MTIKFKVDDSDIQTINLADKQAFELWRDENPEVIIVSKY